MADDSWETWAAHLERQAKLVRECAKLAAALGLKWEERRKLRAEFVMGDDTNWEELREHLLSFEPEWRGTIRLMAQTEYGRSWKKTNDERWLEVAQIAGEAVKNAYTLTEQQQAQAALLYMETIIALKAERGRAHGN
jgi:hypothetical protein